MDIFIVLCSLCALLRHANRGNIVCTNTNWLITPQTSFTACYVIIHSHRAHRLTQRLTTHTQTHCHCHTATHTDTHTHSLRRCRLYVTGGSVHTNTVLLLLQSLFLCVIMLRSRCVCWCVVGICVCLSWYECVPCVAVPLVVSVCLWETVSVLRLLVTVTLSLQSQCYELSWELINGNKVIR